MKTKMLRACCALLSLMLLVSILPVPKAEAADVLSFGVKKGEAFIEECSLNASGKVVVPATYNGYPVTSMAPYAFEKCDKVTEVVLPEGFKEIVCGGFRKCSSLISIYIPDTVTEMEEYAFEGCTSLTGVDLPASLETIGYYAFRDCTALQSISIPDSVTEIATGAFTGCTDLKEVKLSNGMIDIYQDLFSGCTALEHITIPASVEGIWSGSFHGCTGLKTIYFEGDAPLFDMDIFTSDEGVVKATAYYPANNDTWEDVFEDFGGDITWVPYDDSGFTVSGNVTYTVKPVNLQIKLRNEATGEIVYTAVIKNDTYAIENVQPGSYRLVISMDNGLTRSYPLEVTQDVTRDVTFNPPGDVTGDVKTNMGDVAKIFSHVRKKALIDDEYLLACADATGDGRVNIGDVARVFSHVRQVLPLW